MGKMKTLLINQFENDPSYCEAMREQTEDERQQELDHLDNHDCHLSPNDGCDCANGREL